MEILAAFIWGILWAILWIVWQLWLQILPIEIIDEWNFSNTKINWVKEMNEVISKKTMYKSAQIKTVLWFFYYLKVREKKNYFFRWLSLKWLLKKIDKAWCSYTWKRYNIHFI